MELTITEKSATICLNMIVKNESHIIANTLEKLCNKINFDYWVICDTGSTDDTPNIITDFFQKKGIKGELFYDDWLNFAHNRTLALQRAFKKTQLLLVFDADDEIIGNIIMPTEVLFDQYHLKFGSSQDTVYTRVLLINNYKQFEYLSVIHEFISCKENNVTTTTVNGDYYIVSGRSGSRNLDSDKYLKDALILEKAYVEAKEKNNELFHRYAYYCANSYRDCGKFEDAIKWYKTTLSHPNQWNQEKYTSCLYIYECFKSLNQEFNGFYYLVKAFAYDTERVECLYPLLVHYCCENMHRVAYYYYLNVKDFFENHYLNTDLSQKLFATTDKYNFFVPYYMILIADKVQDFKCVIRMYELVFIKKQRMFEEWYVKNFLYNLQFFINHIPANNLNSFVSLAREYMDFLHKNGVNLQKFDFLNKDEYQNVGITLDEYTIKSITHKHQVFSKEECASSKNILFYTGFSNVEWNYTYMLNNALGGSEKAVAYISKCLPKDYNIFISGHVKNETIDNVTYIHLNELTNLIHTIPFHTVIVSRYISFYEMFSTCSFYQSFIWAHDTALLPYGCNLDDSKIIKKWNNFINGCVCLTEWHKNLFIERYPELKDKITLINNGLQLEQFTQLEDLKPFEKIKNKFIYSSRPERGLNILLSLWPQILDKLPNATLSIATYGEFPSNPEEVALKQIIDSYNSIHYLGKLNANKLYEEMQTSEYWLYPTSWPETSCITALEMLMSEVICVYYPVAGLPYTIDKYGIQVSAGEEIETIVSLTEEQKLCLRENGRIYAESCSWEKRAKLWVNVMSVKNNNKNVAIFNGFPFHYETFGCIISYCKENSMDLTIFTHFKNDMGWLDFYKKHFNTYQFSYKNCNEYEDQRFFFDITFITTDDDPYFKNEWFNNNCIAIDHRSDIRRPECKYRIATRPFIKNNRDWFISCYNIFNVNDKINVLDTDINIVIIGGVNDGLNFNIINRLSTIDPNVKIILHILGRNANAYNYNTINSNIFVSIYSDASTSFLFDLLKKCDYILTDVTRNLDHVFGNSCSGCISISFSTLTPLIISKKNNELFKFKNVMEYDLESNDAIFVSKNTINVESLVEERCKLTSMFSSYINKLFNKKENCIPKTIIQTWKSKNLSENFQKIVDSWKIYNPNYTYTLLDDLDCEEFIKTHFDKEIQTIYNCIVSGAHKADLFRYCYLYICGGVYADIDTLCLNKLDDFLVSYVDFVVPIDLNVSDYEGKYNLFNAFMASIPKHPVLLECINMIVYNIKNNIIHPSALDFTGPGILGRCVNKIFGNNETDSFVNKEGIFNNIHFLKFEKNTEYVKDLNNNIIFQNKNGNNNIIHLYNEECNKLTNHISWVSCPANKRINYEILLNLSMFYSDFFDRRKNTFIDSYQLIIERLNHTNNRTYNIIELGSSRSFVNGNYTGCLIPNIQYWNPYEPHKWDWGAGIFTKVFSENLMDKNYNLYTIDPSKDANLIVSMMCSNNNKVKVILDYSTNFLMNFSDKIDFLYMDHMETSEATALIHLQDIKLIIETNLMSEDGIILIDDVGQNIYDGKGKYSIPYLLENNYKILLHEYQVLMIKSKN